MSSCTSRNASARADSYPHDWQRTDGRISPEKALETSHWYFSSLSKRTASSCTSCCRNASAWLQPNDSGERRVSARGARGRQTRKEDAELERHARLGGAVTVGVEFEAEDLLAYRAA